MLHNTPEYTLNTRTNSDRSEDTFYTTCGYTQDTPQYINTCLNTVAIQSWFMYCASVGRIQFEYTLATHTHGPYFTYRRSAPGIPEKYTWKYNARLCVFIGVTWILPEYSWNILKYTLVPYFTCRRSAPGIPEEYTSQYTQNTTRVRVYSLGAHLNTDSYTQVYMYLECVDCMYCECIQT